jgi:GDP-L-fucose synthase
MAMQSNNHIFMTGHRGLAGSAIVRKLRRAEHDALVLRTRQELDLLDQRAVREFFARERIEYVFLAAARVGGIHANATYPAEFLYENMMIAANVIHAAGQSGVSRLMFLGSSCIYPRLAEQPIREESLLTGPLEATNEAYAVAKIAGLKLCEMYRKQFKKDFISAMPTNLYGPGDNFHPENSHVIPGMMRRFHEAKVARAPVVTVWGSGKPKREFLHSDDLAEALYLIMQRKEVPGLINVGTGTEQTVAELAQMMKETVGYEGAIQYDVSRPDGTPRKVLEVSRLRQLGWSPTHDLKSGLASAYRWALENRAFEK